MTDTFKPGDRVRHRGGWLYTITDGPDPVGWYSARRDDGYIGVVSGDYLTKVPTYPTGFANVYPSGVGGFYTTRPVGGYRVEGRIGVIEYHADGSTTMHEVDGVE